MRGEIAGLMLAATVGVAQGQDQSNFQVRTTWEQVFVSGRVVNEPKTRDRFGRLQSTITRGQWSLRASYWDYTSCGWYDLDETTLTYSSKALQIRIGRFIAPIGQANWDDQWYSGFVFVPLIEGATYPTAKLAERTSAGIDLTWQNDADSFRVAVTSRNPNYGRPFADRLDAAAMRYERSIENLQVGLSTRVDTGSMGRDDQIRSADLRWTKDHVIVRAEWLGNSTAGLRKEGFFCDFTYRPVGWQDVTPVFRWERLTDFATASQLESYIVGLKIRLPGDAWLYSNYAFGPAMSKTPLGGGWSFALLRTFRF